MFAAEGRVLEVAQQGVNQRMADAKQFAPFLAHGEFAVKGHVFILGRDLGERLETFGCLDLPELADRQHRAAESDDGFPTPSAQLAQIEAAGNPLVVLQVEMGEVLRQFHQDNTAFCACSIISSICCAVRR